MGLMDPPLPKPAPRRWFDSSIVLVFLVALPLAAIVVAILANTVALRDDPEPRAGVERTAKANAENVAAVEPAKAAGTAGQAGSGTSAGGSAAVTATALPAAKDVQKQETAKGDEPAKALAETKSLADTAGQAGAPAPWQKVLAEAGEPPSYEKVAFLSFEEAFDRPDRDDLTPWFERTDGAGFRLGKIQTPYGRSGTIEGIGRLLSPWPEDGVLRLQLDNFNRLKMHFFHGLTGLTLVYYEDQGNRWAAYATTREAGKPTPTTWSLAATDDDRCRRTELRFGGPIELRCRGGELILSRGDVVLLTAPLAGPPSEVFFEGRATIHGIELARTKDAPAFPAPRLQRAAGVLDWQATKPEIAKPVILADGSVRLAGDKLKQRTECFAALPQTGLQEVILELEGISPGAGVYLGRQGGRPAEVVRFFRDKRSGQLAARLRGADDQCEADFDSPADKPTPLSAPHCWVRLLYGCGNLRWWLSSDGVHWAQVEPAKDNAPPGITSIGLQLVANCPGAGVTLKQVALRRLAGLDSLASAALMERAPAIVLTKTLTDWLPEAMKQKPTEMETAEWLRACSVRTLAGGARRELAYPLLEALLDDAAARGLPLEQQLAALDDAMLLALDLRDGQAMRTGVLSRYPRLGIWAADEHGLPAWSSVRAAYHAAPVVTRLQMPIDLDRAIRWELVADAYHREAQGALDFVERLRFFQQHRERPLVNWIEALADADRTRPTMSGPLVEELSKEAYNALTELKAVLESQAWEDAARLVTTLDSESAPGVAPYLSDRTLLTSLPVAVQLTLEDYPQLRQAMGDKFAALAKLRISQAIAAGDARTIELATVQFAGTPAAAMAHRWLGDRALVGGFFSRAIGEYEKERRRKDDWQAGMSAPREEEIAPRIRLAAAMLGRDAEQPVTAPVQFGEVTMSPAEFESLIAEMKGRESAGVGAPSEAVATAQPTPLPSGFETHVRSRLDGPVGERPQEEVGRRTNQYRVPWADRQLATAIEKDTLYVANHFQVAAYDLKNGKRLWQSQTPPASMQRAQEWAMIPMRPLVAGDHIYIRLLYSPNPLLACLDRSSGKLVWIAESRERELLISDPLLVEGQLVALAIALQPDQQGTLKQYTIDRASGEIVRQRDLLRLRSTWGARNCCEVAALDDGLVAALGGLTVAVDAAGNVRWVRTQTALPADDDPRWVLQMYDRPLVHGERLYVAQPGVRTVECLAAATGRRHWSAVMPEVVGVVGIAGDLLVVRTEAGVRGLDLRDGRTRWRYTADDLYSFQLVNDERLLLARRERISKDAERWQTRLVWIDPADGTPQATTVVPKLDDSDPRLGPLVPYKDRLFMFFGRGQHEATRDVVELVPSGEAEAVLPRPTAWHAIADAASQR
jgi:outer membrane protein assembly factor BamB